MIQVGWTLLSADNFVNYVYKRIFLISEFVASLNLVMKSYIRRLKFKLLQRHASSKTKIFIPTNDVTLMKVVWVKVV